MKHHHFLLLCLPAQGHVNPTLQLAKTLTRAGTLVTFATTVDGLRRMNTTLPTLEGLSYASISDLSSERQENLDFKSYLAESRRLGSQSLFDLLRELSEKGRPVTFLIYTILLPWAAEVARDMHVPSALLVVQSATAFALYHRLFNSQDGLYVRDGEKNNINNLTISLKLPGLPLLTSEDLPSFLFPFDPYYSFLVPCFQEHVQTLEKDPNPCVLINTFEALESDSIKVVCGMNLVTIGPLIPSSFSDGNDSSEKSFGGELFQDSDGYLQWLDSKPDGSVVYVSFGSLAVLKKEQKEEILNGLVESGRPFLWVIREGEGEEQEENGVGEKGLIVRWCSQVEVLCHRAVGCFVTHCGWNSTVESLVAGVPMVGCPQFADQMQNAKMVEEIWGNGVRARKKKDGGVVERGEIRRCLDVVMGGGRGEEIRRNVMKWKGLAREAVKEGGSSHTNLKQFLDILG